MLRSALARWALAVAALANVIPGLDAVTLMRRHHAITSVTSHRSRTPTSQAYSPFDMNAETFMGTLEQIPSDLLILFYDPNCSDCAKLFPVWVQLASKLQGRSGLTLLTVSDPYGLAPGKYGHSENPAMFFASNHSKDDPSALSLDDIHAFTYTEETAATEAALQAAVMRLVNVGQQTAPDPSSSALNDVSKTGKSQTGGILDKASEAFLNARLLATLQAHEKDAISTQLALATSQSFAALPVAQYLRGFTASQVHESLAIIVARYLDAKKDVAT